MALLNTAFGGTYTARLSREIRQERGWSYGAYSRMLRSRRRDAFYLWTFPAIENTVECIEVQIDLLSKLRDGSITDEEFDFARSYLANHFLFAVETPSLRVALAMRQAVLEFPPGFYDSYQSSILGVTPDQVEAAARRFVDPANMVIAVLCTAEKVLPRLEKALGSSATVEVVPWDADV